MKIEVYSFNRADGTSATNWTTQDIKEARVYASEHGYVLLAQVYVWDHTDLVKDYSV